MDTIKGRAIIVFVAGVLSFLCLAARPETQEGRALWVIRDTYRSPADVKRIMQNAADYHFNIILFQIRGNGTVYYPSRLEPWAMAFDGKDPGWDPLKVAVEEAHKHNLELHPWINVYPAWRGEKPHPDPRQLWNSHREWFCVDQEGNYENPSKAYCSLSPTIPAVQDHLFQVYMEVVENYDVDGLHFDYIRFPGFGYSYDPISLAEFKKLTGGTPSEYPQEWNDFRRDGVTALLARTYEAIKQKKPHVKISAAVWWDFREGYNEFLQDSHGWLARGIIDFICPMGYTTDVQGFRILAQDQLANYHNRHIYPGLSTAEVEATLGEVKITRELGGLGNTFFSYRGLFPHHEPSDKVKMLRNTLYAEPASPPPMPWKTSADDDVAGPYISHVSTIPEKARIGQPFYIQCRITDPSGVAMAHEIGQGPFLLWNNDGDLAGGSMVAMTKSEGSDNECITVTSIPAQSLHSNFVCRVYAWDDDCDNGDCTDRAVGYSELTEIIINPREDLYVFDRELGPLIDAPEFMVVDSEGKLWICSWWGDNVRVLYPDGKECPFSPVTKGRDSEGKEVEIYHPSGIAIDSTGVVYVAANATSNTICAFASSDGKPLGGFCTTFPNGDLDFDRANHLFITEVNADRWHVFTKDGKELPGSPFEGGAKGSHVNRGLGVSPDGRHVYIACRADKAAHHYVGSIEDGIASYQKVNDLTFRRDVIGAADVDAAGNLYLSNESLCAIEILSPSHEILGYVYDKQHPFLAPRGVGFAPDGSAIYIVQMGGTSPTRIQKWVRQTKSK
jgi:uncharacterized lipoprotein YddW (UPF0748 family)